MRYRARAAVLTVQSTIIRHGTLMKNRLAKEMTKPVVCPIEAAPFFGAFRRSVVADRESKLVERELNYCKRERRAVWYGTIRYASIYTPTHPMIYHQKCKINFAKSEIL